MDYVVPWHSFFTHFSVALGFLLAPLSAFIWWKIKERDYQHGAWHWVFFCSTCYLVSLVVSAGFGHYDISQVVIEGDFSDMFQDHKMKSYALLIISILLVILSFVGKNPARRRVRQAFVYFAMLSLVPLYLSLSSGSGLIYNYDFPKLFMEQGLGDVD